MTTARGAGAAVARRRRMWETAALPDGAAPAPFWLRALELAWYLLVFGYALSAWPGSTPSWPPAVYVGVAAVTALCVAATLSRRWWPDRLGALAVGVLAVPVVLQSLRYLGLALPLWPVRLTVSGAIQPVLVVVAVRRCRLLFVVPVLAICSLAIRLEGDGASFARVVAARAVGLEPSRPVLVVTALLLFGAPLAAGLLLRFTDAARHAERLARLRAEDRLRTARDLHDTVANHVTGIIVRAQATALDDDLPAGARRGLEVIEETGHRALGAMRRMVETLRSDTAPDGSGPDEPGGTPVAVVRAAIGADADVRLRVDPGPADSGASSRTAAPESLDALRHVTVEALTNARRHRPAGSGIEVELSAPDPDTIALQVINDVGPSSAVPGGGWGLVGLRERVSAAGGDLSAGPVEGGRWRLRLRLPR